MMDNRQIATGMCTTGGDFYQDAYFFTTFLARRQV